MEPLKKKCKLCGKESILVSKELGVCGSCLRNDQEEASRVAKLVHRNSRREFGLPEEVPKGTEGLMCGICSNNCSIPSNVKGYCGIMSNINGKILPTTGSYYKVPGLYYLDLHPTNCVADWVCPAKTGCGYPKYSLSKGGPEYGYYNIAIFYGSCNLDCLFCQNWEYRKMTMQKNPLLSVEDLAYAVNSRTTCACFFGGDPGPNIVHALESSKKMLEEANRERLQVFRICWETNGILSSQLFNRALEYSLISGGIVKVDIKAWTPSIYKALSGNDGRKTFENIKAASSRINERREVPLLVASTLLVPGYIDEYEVENIAKFLVELNEEIPYRLLAFHPEYKMRDLPPTSINHANAALEVAKKAGLKNVSVGNYWLLSNY